MVVKVASPRQRDADVIVVGAGPGGSAAAHYLANYGLDVVVLERATFPRDKVGGDGLTPRTVSEIVRMGVPVQQEDGWQRNKGLRVYGGGRKYYFEWPEIERYPNYGAASARNKLDQTLAFKARESGARLKQGKMVTGPIVHERSDRVIGVRVQPMDENGRRIRDAEEEEFYAPIIMAADGVSARIATALGIYKDENRPMGVAIRARFKTPRHDDEWMESHLELWEGKPQESNLLPGYGWIFPLGDGTVNVGLGSVSSTAEATKIPYRKIFNSWMANAPEEWEFTEENLVTPLRSAALPMAFNRKPLYQNGLFLLGDAGGMVSPFNGEGIAYAMQAGRVAADVTAQAFSRTTAQARERTLLTYPRRMADDIGGYFSLGRLFVKLIEKPEIMRICTTYGLQRPILTRHVMKLLSDSYDTRVRE